MINDLFLAHINDTLEQSEFSQTERKQLEEVLKRMLTNHTPKGLLRLLLEVIRLMHNK